MAVYLNNGVEVTIVPSGGGGAINISQWVSSVTLNRNYDELEVTAMGDSGHKYVAGLEASSITLEFFNDFATSASMATIDELVGKTTTVTVKPTSAATSATNPKYSMTCLINGITPVNGSVADLATSSVTWNVSGTITKTTA